MAGGGISVVKELRHPILKTPLAKDVVTFQTRYQAYEHQVEELNDNSPAAEKIKPTSLEFCIDPPLAEQLVAQGIFDEFTSGGPLNSVDELSDGIVRAWMESRSEVDEADIADRVTLALSDVKYHVSRADARGSVMMFFADVGTNLKEQGCGNVAKNAGKELVKQTLPLIQPKYVRDMIEREWLFLPSQEKYDYLKFQKIVMKNVVDAAKWSGGKRTSEIEEPQDEVAGSRKLKKRRIAAPGKTLPEKRAGAGGKEGDSRNRPESGKKTGKSKWKQTCLNEECDGIHPVKQCPNTSAEKKAELLKKFYDGKNAGSIKSVVLKTPDGTYQNSESNGRWKAILGDGSEVIAKGDDGADYSCISKSLLKSLTQNGVKPREHKFTGPVAIEAFTGEYHTMANSMVRADVTLQLNCGPLRLRDTEWMVVEAEMNEILLGKPLLKALGFDIDEHLEANHAVLHDRKFETNLLAQINSMAYPTGKVSRASCYTGMMSEDADADPIAPVPTAEAAMGEDSEAEIQQAFAEMLAKARKQNMSQAGLLAAKELLQEFRDIFRIRLGNDPPAKIPPMEVKLKPNAKPVKSNQRRYAPAQRAFISTTIKKLERVGAVRANPTARWASPALAVPKPGSEGYRFTVDSRRANNQVEPMASSMPHLESLFQSVSGSKFFSKIDLCHAYWQLALASAEQEIFSIQTPVGIYSPTRLIQGSTDAGNYFQGTTEPLFRQEKELRDNMVQWLDDFMLHAQTEQQLIRMLRVFFSTCRTYGLKIHALKTDLFSHEANFCGRIFDKDGMRFHPSKFESLRSMQQPELAADLLQFTFAMNWMRSSIPNYSEIVAPLLELLEICYKEVGGRTKKKLGKLSLNSKWGTIHQSAFTRLRHTLEDQIKLALPKPDYEMVLCTDASETHWSGVLTQVKKSERCLPVQEQQHEPLGFVSGSFKKASFSWATVEKEAFAVVESFVRFEHLVGGREVSLYTDHANLVYIFDPIGQNPGIARHTASKLTRWAVKLSSFRYVIEAIAGEANHMADLMTRWAVRPRSAVQRVIAKVSRSSLVVAPISPQSLETSDWPDVESLRASQKGASERMPQQCMIDERGLATFESGAIWIPESDKLMQLRVLIAAHMGPGGHRGAKTTISGMERYVQWKSMQEDTKAFVGSCIHCLSTTTGGKVPRPTAQTLHATGPNKMLHMDYLYIYPGIDGYEYVLVLKDDFSSFLQLVKCKTADAETTVEALVGWFSTFGVVLNWVSDRGTHFKNEVVDLLKEQSRASHRFTLAYAPWSNGTVEVVNREILRVLRALCSELKLPYKEWPSLLPVVQGVLNSAALPRLNGKAPLTVMTGLPADRPLASIIASQNGHPEIVDGTKLEALKNSAIAGAVAAFEGMHKEVKEKQTAARQSKIDAHNRKTNVKPCNFVEGDYVLRGVRAGQHKSKLALRWTGPYRVAKVLSDYVFVLEHLLSGKRTEVHGTRIMLFRNSTFEVTQEMRDHIIHQEGELYNVERFLGFRNNQGIPQVRVSWQGLDEQDDSWEDVKQIREDVPVLFKQHVDECRRSGSAKDKAFLRRHRI